MNRSLNLFAGLCFTLTPSFISAQDSSPATEVTETSADELLLMSIKQAIAGERKLSPLARGTEVSKEGDKIKLVGRVQSASEKTLVEQIATRVAKGTPLINKIKVNPHISNPAGGDVVP